MTTVNHQEQRKPRAMIHKQILDSAKARPDATIEELASTVNGATANLVERVLDEYGDPGRDPQSTADQETESEPSLKEVSETLTDKQREILRCIYEHPTASQREIASLLDVTHTTVYHHTQSMDDFEWDDRYSFVSGLFDSTNHDCQDTVDRILDTIEQDPHEEGNDSPPPRSVFTDPKLVRKVIHACIDADGITHDEFHLIVEDFMQRTYRAQNGGGN